MHFVEMIAVIIICIGCPLSVTHSFSVMLVFCYRYAEERAADRDRGRCEEILCVRTGSVASSRDTSLSRRGTSQERESSEDKGSQEPKDEAKYKGADSASRKPNEEEPTAMKPGEYFQPVVGDRWRRGFK